MRITYSPDTRSLGIQLANRPGVEAEELAPGLVVDFDADGRVVGIEIEDVAALGLDVSELEVSGLPITKVLGAGVPA